MSSFNQYLSEKLMDPAFQAEYNELEAEFSIMQARIDARKDSSLSPKQLAEKTDITHSSISDKSYLV